MKSRKEWLDDMANQGFFESEPQRRCFSLLLDRSHAENNEATNAVLRHEQALVRRATNAITILQAQCDARDKELDEIREALAKALAKTRHIDDTMTKLKSLIQTGWLLSPDPAPPTPGEGDRGPLDWGLPGDWEFKGYDLFNPHSADHMSDERWIRKPTLEETVTRAYDAMQGVDDAGN